MQHIWNGDPGLWASRRGWGDESIRSAASGLLIFADRARQKADSEESSRKEAASSRCQCGRRGRRRVMRERSSVSVCDCDSFPGNRGKRDLAEAL